jgi:Domain of unknown function (DUF4177)
MDKWEYKFVPVPSSTSPAAQGIELMMNRWGEEGWELAGVVPQVIGYVDGRVGRAKTETQITYIFKRRKQ